jgi:hypothetical protein
VVVEAVGGLVLVEVPSVVDVVVPGAVQDAVSRATISHNRRESRIMGEA